jgi:hypothetical protein
LSSSLISSFLEGELCLAGDYFFINEGDVLLLPPLFDDHPEFVIVQLPPAGLC